MKGIIQGGMKPQREPQQSQEAQDEAQVPQGFEQATEEEQAAYEKAALAATKVLHDEATHPQIMKMLEAGKDDPAAAMAEVTSMVVIQLDEQSGGTIPEVVILPVTEEILPQVAELASAAKLFEPDERVMNMAMQQTIIKLGDQYGVSEEEIQELIQSLPQDQVQQMVAEQQQYAQPQQQAQPQPTGA